VRIIFHEIEQFIKLLIPAFFFFHSSLTGETRISSTKYLDLISYIKEHTLRLDHNDETIQDNLSN